jgi:hypothetical protein
MRERVYHHYEDLEEYHIGMWRIVRGKKRKEFVANAAALMQQPDEFKDAMLKALDAWPKSCDANLTAEAVNRIAWLGHAGCCIATGSPEEATRAAWHTLAQDEANRVAGEVLDLFIRRPNKADVQRSLFDEAA